VRYDVKSPADQYLSLVLSQYQKSRDLAYSLSCYCTEPFTLSEPTEELRHTIELRSAWTQRTAAGPLGSPGFLSNPSFAVSLPSPGSTVIQLIVSTSKSSPVNVVLVPVRQYGQLATEAIGEPALDSGRYKHGFVVSERVAVPAGAYLALVSNYFPGQQVPFVLKVMSSRAVRVEELSSMR
jgi:calpain-7